MSAELVFRDEYVLDFLGLPVSYDERDLEEAILREMERFISELGSDFAFVGRQKRMTVDGVDYRLDLLFFESAESSLGDAPKTVEITKIRLR